LIRVTDLLEPSYNFSPEESARDEFYRKGTGAVLSRFFAKNPFIHKKDQKDP